MSGDFGYKCFPSCGFTVSVKGLEYYVYSANLIHLPVRPNTEQRLAGMHFGLFGPNFIHDWSAGWISFRVLGYWFVRITTVLKQCLPGPLR